MLRTRYFGKGDPIILFNGASDSMDAWDPSFLTEISSNHTVIAFINVELEIRQPVPNHILCSSLAKLSGLVVRDVVL